MNDQSPPLKLVDGFELAEKYRQALRPGQLLADREGRLRRLPRFFYEISSREAAREIELTPHFSLWELITVDVRETEVLRDYPRYVPCAITVLAACLELLREKVGTFVHVAANGGYRSPAHALSRDASTHLWGTAANIYRIGDEYLDDQERIERFGAIAAGVLPGVWVRPYGNARGYADDHLHLDLGYITVVPREAAGEEEDRPPGAGQEHEPHSEELSRWETLSRRRPR